MLRPVVNPEDTVPIDTMPLNGGASVTTAPGTAVNVLLFGAAENSWAWTVTVDPISANPTVALKKPERDVTVPSRGTENAIFVSAVASIATK